MNKKQLAEGVLCILSPLRGIWEDTGWLIEAIEKDLVSENHLGDLADLLMRATATVNENERILAFSQASELVRNNREQELVENLREQEECGDIIRNII